jgi:hypothetical protein
MDKVCAPVSCHGRVQRALARAERDPGSRGDTTGRFNTRRLCRETPGSRVSLRSPGTRACDIAARAADRWPSLPIHNVKQRSVVRSRGALLRPGLCVSSQVPSLLRPPASPQGLWCQRPSRQQRFRPPPMRGDGAPTGALFLSVAPATRDHPVPGRPGPLSALHRGGFRMRTHASVSRQWDQSRSDCPRQAITAWRSGSGPPYVAVRAASAGRHSLLRLAGSFLENAPSEPGCKSYIINSLRSQEISSYRRRYF